jgi:hypothetical protein
VSRFAEGVGRVDIPGEVAPSGTTSIRTPPPTSPTTCSAAVYPQIARALFGLEHLAADLPDEASIESDVA